MCKYLHTFTPNLHVWSCIFTCMHTAFTSVCVCSYIIFKFFGIWFSHPKSLSIPCVWAEFTRVCIYVYIHTHQVYRVYMYVCVCAFLHVHTLISMCVYKYVHICMPMGVCIFLHYVCVRAYICFHVCVCVFTYMHHDFACVYILHKCTPNSYVYITHWIYICI